MIDLRSDTVTRPTPAMLEAISAAAVGDDVFQEDPTVIQLEQKLADLLGMEAGIFCPSGTMTNQIAINVHTRPGDEVICHNLSHVYHYEGGGIACNSGASVRLLDGDRGRFTANDVLSNINPDDVHHPVSRLVVIENTCNKGGGSYWGMEDISSIRQTCDDNNLNLHLDGARLFNALVKTGQSPLEYGGLFDSISICLSKGLGAPIGSVLLGSAEFVHQARRVRKVFGGGMRQVGYLAAAGIYALDNHIERLAEDHRRAEILGNAVKEKSFVAELLPVDTNIVIFRINDKVNDTAFINQLEKAGILAVSMGHQLVRFVTHLDFDDDMLTEVIQTLNKI